MKTGTKVCIIIASSLVLLGIVIFGGAMLMLNWNFRELSTVKRVTNEHEISEVYKDISLVTDTADVVFVASKTNKTSVVCYEEEKLAHTVSVKDGRLTIELCDRRAWYEKIGINFGTSKITVYLPEGEYGALYLKSTTGNVEIPAGLTFESMDFSGSTGDVKSLASVAELVKIKRSTGDIYLENISVGSLDLSVSTGKVSATDVLCAGNVGIEVSTGKTYLSDLTCKNLSTTGNTGDITLKNTVASEKFSIERTTGDVYFERCDAAEMFVVTDTGDVKGTLLSEKVFIAKTDTGRIKLPKTVSGGICEISTDTGDIKIDIE